MDVVQRELLLRHRDSLVHDVLMPESLLPLLRAGNILSHEDCNLIYSQATPQARMRQLLDLLPGRGPTAFAEFCKALQKDYSWLSESLNTEAQEVASQSQHDEPDFKEELYLDAKLRGGVPLSPAHFVFRQHEVEKVRETLKQLGHRQCLVLHGMAGSGKSCLAAAALNSKDLILGTFKGVVLWLSLGDGVLPAQLALLYRLDRHWPLPLQHRTSNHLPYPSTEDFARDTLIARILHGHPDLKQGLLVLDDINQSSQSAARAFNIGLKMLLLTQDSSAIEPLLPQCIIIKMIPGFSEEESIQLLASSVDMSPSDVWPEAYDIHRKAQGFPLVIALIGGLLTQFKEDARSSATRWQEYSDMLSNRHRRRRNSFSNTGLMEAISQSLNTLTPLLRQHYHQLVVFDNDVNILPEVLAILWGLSKYEVEENMSILTRKSLASRRWNEELRCYVYGVHYLLLYYLHTTLEDDAIKKCHEQLVHQYTVLVGGDWSLLPNDNYAHLFLAKHMSQSSSELARSLLPNLLLNISFITTRLRLNVPEDLLRDFERLKEIIQGDENSKTMYELKDYENFVVGWGDVLRKYSFLDSVQCALQEPPNSHVHHAALQLALSDTHSSSRYIVMQVHSAEAQKKPNPLRRNYELPGIYSAACLCCHNILLAHQSGAITLVNPELDKTLQVLNGLSTSAVCLEVSPDHTGFAAATANGEVLFWNLPRNACECANPDVTTPPPRLRQLSWQPVHENTVEQFPIRVNSGEEESIHCGLSISTYDDLLAWHSGEQIKVWRIQGDSADLLWNLDKVSPISCVAFGINNSVLFVAAGDIYLLEAKNGKILQVLAADNPIYIFPLKDSSTTGGWCLELNNSNFVEWEWWSQNLESSWFPRGHPIKTATIPSTSFTSAMVSPDQNMIVAVTVDAHLLVLERTSRVEMCKIPITPSHLVASVTQPNNSWIKALLKSPGGSFCILDIVLINEPVPLVPIPSAPVWSDNQQWAAHLDSAGRLRVHHRDQVGSTNVIPEVTVLASDGYDLHFGTSTGQVAFCSVSENSTSQVVNKGHFTSAVTYISCTEGWLIASSCSLNLLACSPSCTRWCDDLQAPILSSAVLHNQLMLLCWDLATPKVDNQCEALVINPLAKHDIITCALDATLPEPVIVWTTKYLKLEVNRLQLKPSPQLVRSFQIQLPEAASMVGISPSARRLVVVIPAMQTLQLLDGSSGQQLAVVSHSLIPSITQIEFNGTTLVTAGNMLAWWKLPRVPNGTLRLKHTLQLKGQWGSVRFCISANKTKLLVSDSGGSLWIVKPLDARSPEDIFAPSTSISEPERASEKRNGLPKLNFC